jgi:exopolyphosphatase/guanosine-5'-triphosphate,3'-diphosphate pyrophosphatase
VSIAIALCRKYNMDMSHVEQVARLSMTLFEDCKPLLGLKTQDSLYLLLAAYLHDIGMFIYNRAHHKHTEYIISNLSLFRLTQNEIKVIACIARYHRRKVPAGTHLLYQSLPKDKQILVLKLSALLRIANALDRCHGQKVKKIELQRSPSQDITLTAHVEGNFLNEKLDFQEKKDIFEEISGSKLDLKIKYL